MQQTEEHEHIPVHSQNITYSEAVKLNADTVQPLDADGVTDAKTIAVNKIDESVTVAVEISKPMSPKPIQVRKISRFQVSHVQEDILSKINTVQSNIAPVEVSDVSSVSQSAFFFQPKLCVSVF